MIRKEFTKILVCPICLNSLIYDEKNNELLCLLNKIAFPIYKNIPVLLIHFARKIINK
ncbi:MAG: hypothetical protein UAT33_01685 [Buchnera aphidicola (Floraphis choui)]